MLSISVGFWAGGASASMSVGISAFFTFFFFGISFDWYVRFKRQQAAITFERQQAAKGLVKFVDIHGNVKWGRPAEVIKWKERQHKLESIMDNKFDELTSSNACDRFTISTER